MKAYPVIIAVLAALGLAQRASADLTTSAGAAVSWEENLTRCPDPAAVKSGTFYEATANADWRTQLSRDIALHFGLDAGLQNCREFSGLDRSTAGFGGGIQRKLGLGPLAPVLRADASYTGSWYRDTTHSGTRLDASIAWSQRWSDTWQTVVTGEYRNNDGHYMSYDYKNHGLGFEARYDLSDKWQLTAGLKRQWGDQVTYAWLGGSGAFFPYVSQIWKNTEESDLFGHNWFAYTMDAHADIVRLSASYAINSGSSLALSFETTSVVGHGESYHNRQLSLNFAFRF